MQSDLVLGATSKKNTKGTVMKRRSLLFGSVLVEGLTNFLAKIVLLNFSSV